MRMGEKRGEEEERKRRGKEGRGGAEERREGAEERRGEGRRGRSTSLSKIGVRLTISSNLPKSSSVTPLLFITLTVSG